jgi:predicted RNA-binding Zn ribbon-like protein
MLRAAPSRQSFLHRTKLMEEHMPKVLFPLVGLVIALAAALPRAEANVAAPAPSAPGATSAVEEVQARTCMRQRVCGPRGCAWRTVCRRAPMRGGPRMMGPGMM